LFRCKLALLAADVALVALVGLDQFSWHDDLTLLRLLNAALEREVPREECGMTLGKPTGARFEILIDGKPRSYRDTKPVALEAAEYLKADTRTARSR
jgi:hypothetical protein